MRRLIAVPILMVLAAACASGGPEEVGGGKQLIPSDRIRIGELTGDFTVIRALEDIDPRADTIPASPDRVWALLPSVYRQMNIPLTALNQEARVLGASSIALREDLGSERPSRYFHCGRTITGTMADQYQLIVTAMSQVRAVEGQEDATEIVTALDAIAQPTATSSNTVMCSSRHRLEGEIVDRIRRELAGTDDPGD